MLPRIMTDHVSSTYGESLELFLRTHPDCFMFCDNNVKLDPNFESASILADKDNEKPVSLFPWGFSRRLVQLKTNHALSMH